ncbi:MAG: hypothetical protein AAFY03_11765 [Pseudomonadota bacterium]
MILKETAPVSAAALPLDAFRDHLRLGSGFTGDPSEDGLLTEILHSAVGTVESWTNKALFRRTFTLSVTRWRKLEAQPLPIGPVEEALSLALRGADGVETVVDPDDYRICPDLHIPVLEGAFGCLPMIPTGGTAVLTFNAGFSIDWSGVPSPLRRAVLLLAGRFYEDRSCALDGGLPVDVASILGAWRPVRLKFGAAS